VGRSTFLFDSITLLQAPSPERFTWQWNAHILTSTFKNEQWHKKCEDLTTTLALYKSEQSYFHATVEKMLKKYLANGPFVEIGFPSFPL
jgi:hypothetical protein